MGREKSAPPMDWTDFRSRGDAVGLMNPPRHGEHPRHNVGRRAATAVRLCRALLLTEGRGSQNAMHLLVQGGISNAAIEIFSTRPRTLTSRVTSMSPRTVSRGSLILESAPRLETARYS